MSNYEALQLLNGLSSSGSSYGSTAQGIGIWSIIALILSIVGGILVYFLFVKQKAEPKGKFLKWLKDFLTFKIMWIEPILKVVYYILTIFVVLYSFTFLALGGYGILPFFLCLILGPIVVRLGYEMTMMFIMIWRNTRDIAENTKKK
jgi:hypothetical protein